MPTPIPTTTTPRAVRPVAGGSHGADGCEWARDGVLEPFRCETGADATDWRAAEAGEDWMGDATRSNRRVVCTRYRACNFSLRCALVFLHAKMAMHTR